MAALVAALMMTAGIALAESFRGDDDLYGLGGADEIFGNRGDDDIFGGNGRDTIFAGRGDDHVDVQGDGRIDEASCGSGRDAVRANPEDNPSGDCEVAKGVARPK
jgi:Ca2+-binding RTX toxin-like protein